MLDNNCIKFLKYLSDVREIKDFEFFNFFSVNNIDFESAKNYQKYLLEEDYIRLVKNDFIVPSFRTTIFFTHDKESKFKNIFVTYLLPYIQEFTIFILGLITPYLIKILEQILKYIGIF